MPVALNALTYMLPLCLSVSTISSWLECILITLCLWPPLAQKIVIPMQQQGKKSRDPQWDEFIRSVGQLGQLITLLSWRQEEEGGRGRGWMQAERGRGNKKEEKKGCEGGTEGGR